MICSLQLRYHERLEAGPEAWFLPGNSSDRWLEELAKCGLATTETRLFVVPQSIQDCSPAGLLVVPPLEHSLPKLPAGLPCRLIAGRMFVPIDAVLFPPVTDSELRALCPLPVSFFHPAFGLSGFEAEAMLRVNDLITLPQESSTNWNCALAGTPGLPKLEAIVLLQPPSIENIFGGADEEIGSEPVEDLPPAPDEPKKRELMKARHTLRRIIGQAVLGITRQIPHTGSARTWVNDLEDWAVRQLQTVNEQLERLRNKEIHRLLHLLDTDPEKGLRHAIPLNNFAHRGIAPPGFRLGARSLDFDPSRLGGRPVDFWNVGTNLHEALRRRYREMADREMQLGRHRRAAYIYAELLGDLVSAANALKQGQLFREAALLYEEHLKNPLEAARCLAAGGLLADAIERYEKLGRWLEVAELQERLGNRTASEDAIRRVVHDRLAQNDILGAAKLVEEHLHNPDEALNMLLGAWPSSHQAVSCIGAAFQLLARLGRHNVTLERLRQFEREPVQYSLASSFVATLVTTAREYPHQGVRHRAADFSRVLIARQLQHPACTSEQSGRLLEHLVRLAPQDRLLSRDANRFIEQHRATEFRASRVTSPPVRWGNKLILHRRFELPCRIQWLRLRNESHFFYALGVTTHRVTLLRGTWEGHFQTISWTCSAQVVKHGFVFEPTREQGSRVTLARPGGKPLEEKTFPASDLFFKKECFAGTPSWLPTEGFPFAFEGDVVWTVHLATGCAILSCYDKVRGKLLRTIDITDDLVNNAERTEDTHLSLTALTDGVAVALGNRLVLTNETGGLTRVELPGQAVRLFPTLPNTRQGVAVMLRHGAVMHWRGAGDCLELDRDFQAPIGAFVPGGPMILVSDSRLMLIEVDFRGVHSAIRTDLTGQRAIGVSPTGNAGEFALLGENGQMSIYRVSR